ncbi:MAG: methyl-accepting chemotaxis protein [Acidimicrobiales bacterium]
MSESPRPKRSVQLKTKLIASFTILGLVPALLLGWVSFQRSAAELQMDAASRLQEAAVTYGDMIDRNLFERYGDVQAFAANPNARTTATATDRQNIVDFLTINYGIYDLMLIVDLDGNIIAANTVDGSGAELDSLELVGQSVADTEWFATVAGGKTPPGGTHYTDAWQNPMVAAVYGQSRLTLPFTAPIFDDDGAMVGIWHNEASFERIVSDIMNEGRRAFVDHGHTTVETQILRADGVVLDDADQSVIGNLNLAEAGQPVAQLALGPQGSTGSTIERSVRTDVEQVMGYAVTDGALGFDGYKWGVLVRQNLGEAAAAATSLRNLLFSIGLFIMAATALIGLLLARSIANPLRRNVAALEDVSTGDLSVRFEVGGQDEVGQMSSALNRALDSIGGTLTHVDRSAIELSDSAGQLTTLSREMASTAGHASQQASDAANEAEKISSGSLSVAAAMEQMSTCIREISDNSSTAAQMTSKVVDVSTQTRSRMERLDASAVDIGNVVAVITSIAAQTDLLALNATIEAHRVGEAGKGFGVVANEVKALAAQTSGATDQIQGKIEAIQSDVVNAVEAMSEIGDLLDQVNEISTAIAGAVEEQSATAAEVSDRIQSVTDGTAKISDSVSAVAEANKSATEGADKTLDSAARLSGLADQLAELLKGFTLPGEHVAQPQPDSEHQRQAIPKPVPTPELVPVGAKQQPTLTASLPATSATSTAVARPEEVIASSLIETATPSTLDGDLLDAGWQ